MLKDIIAQEQCITIHIKKKCVWNIRFIFHKDSIKFMHVLLLRGYV